MRVMPAFRKSGLKIELPQGPCWEILRLRSYVFAQLNERAPVGVS